MPAQLFPHYGTSKWSTDLRLLGGVAPTNSKAGITVIEQLLTEAIESSADFSSIRQLLATARTFGLTAYDAVYLDTARHERLPLATLDRKLQSAAREAGVEIFP